MAKTKTIVNEREYIINLRREILKVPRYKRAPKAMKAMKQFIAKHMRIPDRDINKVKIDKYLNQELWFRGIKKPVTKVKVRVKRDGDLIRVELIDLTDKVKFEIAREEKIKKAAEKSKKEKAKEEKEKKEEKVEQKTEEEVKEEKEKAESVKESKEKQAQEKAKEAKHVQIAKQPKTQPHRKALKK